MNDTWKADQQSWYDFWKFVTRRPPHDLTAHAIEMVQHQQTLREMNEF